MRHFIGVDLGGTHLRAAVVDPQDGSQIAVSKISSEAQKGPEAVIDRIIQMVEDVITRSKTPKSQIGGIGIGVPGLVNQEEGRLLIAPNLPGDWADVPLVERISEKVGLPVHLLNDVRSITLGEWAFGAGRGVDTMVCYAIGTGIGGGVVVGGKLHLGLSGAAGELGHQPVEIDGLPCNCGGRGCLEMYASGLAITAQAVQAVVQRRLTRIGAMARNRLEQISVKEVVQAARLGDEVAKRILERAGTYLGIGISNSVVTLAPDRVVFAGGVSTAGELLLGPAKDVVRQRVHLVPVDRISFVQAELGDDAGLVGAALWASQS